MNTSKLDAISSDFKQVNLSEQVWFVKPMANSVYLNKTVPEKLSDSALHCLLMQNVYIIHIFTQNYLRR